MDKVPSTDNLNHMDTDTSLPRLPASPRRRNYRLPGSPNEVMRWEAVTTCRLKNESMNQVFEWFRNPSCVILAISFGTSLWAWKKAGSSAGEPGDQLILYSVSPHGSVRCGRYRWLEGKGSSRLLPASVLGLEFGNQGASLLSVCRRSSTQLDYGSSAIGWSVHGRSYTLLTVRSTLWTECHHHSFFYFSVVISLWAIGIMIAGFVLQDNSTFVRLSPDKTWCHFFYSQGNGVADSPWWTWFAYLGNCSRISYTRFFSHMQGFILPWFFISFSESTFHGEMYLRWFVSVYWLPRHKEAILWKKWRILSSTITGSIMRSSGHFLGVLLVAIGLLFVMTARLTKIALMWLVEIYFLCSLVWCVSVWDPRLWHQLDLASFWIVFQPISMEVASRDLCLAFCHYLVFVPFPRSCWRDRFIFGAIWHSATGAWIYDQQDPAIVPLFHFDLDDWLMI